MHTTHDHPAPGSDEYAEHVRGEIAHYGKIFETSAARESLMQPVPPAWLEIDRRAAALIRSATGNDLDGHMLDRLGRQPGTRMLSLGSGPGGVELTYARRAPDAEIVCIDLSPSLLELGRDRARDQGLAVRFVEGDLNTVDLPVNEFDIVFCHAAFHHVIELERLADQIKRSLRREGVLITEDVVTPNGYGMWPDTRRVVGSLWPTLPERFRVNRTGYAEPRVDEQIWESDTSVDRMECVRSQDILPVLNSAFEVEHFVPYFSLSRRFFDTMYGPNYDLTSPLDMALLNWIWELDTYYLSCGRLKPETFFGIYCKPS